MDQLSPPPHATQAGATKHDGQCLLAPRTDAQRILQQPPRRQTDQHHKGRHPIMSQQQWYPGQDDPGHKGSSQGYSLEGSTQSPAKREERGVLMSVWIHQDDGFAGWTAGCLRQLRTDDNEEKISKNTKNLNGMYHHQIEEVADLMKSNHGPERAGLKDSTETVKISDYLVWLVPKMTKPATCLTGNLKRTCKERKTKTYNLFVSGPIWPPLGICGDGDGDATDPLHSLFSFRQNEQHTGFFAGYHSDVTQYSFK